MFKNITFDERYDSKEYETTTFYFVAPKELLPTEYSEAVHAEISIECPMAHIEPAYASVMISPTRCDPENPESFEDYDWCDYNMPYDEIEALITLATM